MLKERTAKELKERMALEFKESMAEKATMNILAQENEKLKRELEKAKREKLDIVAVQRANLISASPSLVDVSHAAKPTNNSCIRTATDVSNIQAQVHDSSQSSVVRAADSILKMVNTTSNDKSLSANHCTGSSDLLELSNSRVTGGNIMISKEHASVVHAHFNDSSFPENRFSSSNGFGHYAYLEYRSMKQAQEIERFRRQKDREAQELEYLHRCLDDKNTCEMFLFNRR